MPTGIAPSDRKLLLAGGAVAVLLLSAIAALSPPQEERESLVPSTYSTQSAGASAAFRLLAKLGYPVRRWESPPTELTDDPETTLLVLAEPMQPATAAEKKALSDFVEDGGHVLFTGAAIHEYFPDATFREEPPDPGVDSFSAILPTRVSRDALHISLQPQATGKELAAGQIGLYGETGKSVVVGWPKREGYVLWWAASTPLTNAGITREDNLRFFLNSVGNWDDTQTYHIYWDEYFHGQRSSVWSYVAKTSLAWSVAQLGLLAIAVLWTFSRRSGPVFVPAAVSRLSPLEFVDTLGGLYERAGAGAAAVSITLQRLRTLLARQLGLAANTPLAELAAGAETRLGWKNSGLGKLFVHAEMTAGSPKVYPQEALDLVRQLEEFIARLDVRSQARREKT